MKIQNAKRKWKLTNWTCEQHKIEKWNIDFLKIPNTPQHTVGDISNNPIKSWICKFGDFNPSNRIWLVPHEADTISILQNPILYIFNKKQFQTCNKCKKCLGNQRNQRVIEETCPTRDIERSRLKTIIGQLFAKLDETYPGTCPLLGPKNWDYRAHRA